MPPSKSRRIGVISDTHGLLRPEAAAALAGCELIVHAGDIGKPAVLRALEGIAPTLAVRGNVDAWASSSVPERRVVEWRGERLYVLHDLKQLDLDPAETGFSAVVAGHSHRPSRHVRDGVLYLNPGSAGPRRFDLPVTLAHVRLAAGAFEVEIVELNVPPPVRRAPRRRG